MGLHIHGVHFALDAMRHGVSFERTATLGRQALGIGRGDLRRAFAKAGVALEPDRERRIMDNAGHSPAGYAEAFFESCGARTITAIDRSGYEGAELVHDLNEDLPERLDGAFTCVLDAGTLEHVFDVPVAIRSCMNLVAPGGHFLAVSPANNLAGHGFYQFSPELYWSLFSEANGFSLERMFVTEMYPSASWYVVADPKALGARVVVRNALETLLLVQARRIGATRLTRLHVQQSDYVDLWAGGQPEQNPLGRRAGRVRRLARRVLPEVVKARLRGFAAAAEHPFPEPFFRRYDARDRGGPES